MPAVWPHPTNKVVGDPGFVADVNQLAVNVNELNDRDDAKVAKALVDAKGDLLVGTAADTVGRLAVGANGRFLLADSAQAAGLKWTDRLADPAIVERAGTTFVDLIRSDAPADARRGQIVIDSAGVLSLRTVNDAASVGQVAIAIGRANGDVTIGNTQFLRGSGSPEGAITATVGARYIDSNATNGAVEWVKASGTGNTGWRVVHGDTGWRNVTSVVTWDDATSNPNARGLLIKRTHAGLHLHMFWRQAANSASAQIVATGLPAGFLVDRTTRFIPGANESVAGTFPGSWQVTTAGVVNGLHNAAGHIMSAQISALPAAGTWPTGALPGTAA